MSRSSFVPLLLLIALTGCAPSTPASSTPATTSGIKTEPGKKLRIAVIPKGTTHEFWKSVHFGAEKAAKELGNVEILWKGPLQENDREGQINVVQDFITRRVDGICLAPLDSQSLVGPVHDAQSEKIPTVIFDSGLDDKSVIVSYVATDNYKGGALAAQTLAKSLGGKGNVLLMRYNPGSQSTEEREKGFLETLAKENPGIKIVSSNQYAGTTPESSLEKAQLLTNQYAKDLNGVFAVCEPNSIGMLRALSEAKLAGQVKFVAFDPAPPLVHAMQQDEIAGIVLQDPVNMGYLAVKTIVAHLGGEKVSPQIDTGEFVATKANMETAEMKRLLDPPQYSD